MNKVYFLEVLAMTKAVLLGSIVAMMAHTLYIKKEEPAYDELPFLMCQGVLAPNNVEYTQCRFFPPVVQTETE